MSVYTLYMIIGFAAIYSIYFYITFQKRKKLKASFENMDMRIEEGNADSYTRELITNDYPYVADEMMRTPIDAFTIVNIEHTAKDVVKDVAKDVLKSAATLGIVRYRTVQTPKFLVLSGNALHLLDTDVDGKISNHFIFDNASLKNASIKEQSLTKIEISQGKFIGKVPKQYKLIISADEANQNILLYDVLVPALTDSTAGALFNQTDKYPKKYIVANYFLKKLGEEIPGLKVETAFSL